MGNRESHEDRVMLFVLWRETPPDWPGCCHSNPPSVKPLSALWGKGGVIAKENYGEAVA
jgi:hypothetical protein